MTSEVSKSLKNIIKSRKEVENEPVVDGISGFLFLNRNGDLTSAKIWQERFNGICSKYNKSHETKIPKVTPHICRHTFCTKMARSGMNPKTLQYIMGHSNISVTLDIYTHIRYDDVQNELERVYESMKIY